MTHIIKETPVGLIDGVNTVFNFSKEIKEIENLWVDGAMYSDYTFNGNSVFLSDAPRISIFGDYFDKDKKVTLSTEYIAKEIPKGEIDGINKVFQCEHTIASLDDLWVDGAIYTHYIISGRTITLEHAPTLSVFVDYIPIASTIDVDTDITFGDVKSEIWRLLGQKPTSINFSDKVLSIRINSTLSEIWNGKIINILNPNETIIAGKMPFQEGSKNFKISNKSTLKKRLKIDDTEIHLDNTDFSYRGYVMISGEIFEYAKKTQGNLKGISRADTEHYEGEIVEELYALPYNFGKIRNVVKIVTGSNGTEEIDIPFNEGKVRYEVLNTKNNITALRVSGLSKGDEIKVYYIKKAPRLIDDNELFPLPDQYGITVVATLVAGQLAFESLLPMYESLLSIAYPNLRNMYSYFAEDIRVIKQKLRLGKYKFGSIRL